MNEFFEKHWWAQILAALLVTFAVSFFVVWFPYGFIVADLTINPMEWPTMQRATLIGLWASILLITSFGAVS